MRLHWHRDGETITVNFNFEDLPKFKTAQPDKLPVHENMGNIPGLLVDSSLSNKMHVWPFGEYAAGYEVDSDGILEGPDRRFKMGEVAASRFDFPGMRVKVQLDKVGDDTEEVTTTPA